MRSKRRREFKKIICLLLFLLHLTLSMDGDALPLPLGEVAEHSEDGEGRMAITIQGPLSHLR